MKRAQVIALAIAGLAGLGAAFFISTLVQPPPAPVVETREVNTVEVLVAASEIALGQTVNEGSFRWLAWPTEAAARGYITKQNGGTSKVRELAGSIARAPLLAGEPVTPAKLIKAGQGGVLAAILPQGMRAISTKIKAETAAGSLILPNDHVDVIIVRRIRIKSGGEEVNSDTLFRNIRVIAIGQQIETKEGKKAADSSASTATLELTPRQAQDMALANALGGDITLSLRSVADLSTDPSGGGLDLNKQRGSAVRVLRYGAKSRVYGVN